MTGSIAAIRNRSQRRTEPHPTFNDYLEAKNESDIYADKDIVVLLAEIDRLRKALDEINALEWKTDT